MSVDKIKHKIKNRRKLTYKELEWDYLPMIVLFAVVTGILTLLFILLIVYQDSLAEEELSRLRKFRLFNNYLNNEEYVRPTEVIEMEDVFIEDN